jgi:allantoinase
MALDLILKNIRVVRPDGDGPEDLDIGILDGKIARLEKNISPDDTNKVHDGGGRLVFPGFGNKPALILVDEATEMNYVKGL